MTSLLGSCWACQISRHTGIQVPTVCLSCENGTFGLYCAGWSASVGIPTTHPRAMEIWCYPPIKSILVKTWPLTDRAMKFWDAHIGYWSCFVMMPCWIQVHLKFGPLWQSGMLVSSTICDHQPWNSPTHRGLLSRGLHNISLTKH